MNATPGFSRIAATDFVAPGLASLIFDSTGGFGNAAGAAVRAQMPEKAWIMGSDGTVVYVGKRGFKVRYEI